MNPIKKLHRTFSRSRCVGSRLRQVVTKRECSSSTCSLGTQMLVYLHDVLLEKIIKTFKFIVVKYGGAIHRFTGKKSGMKEKCAIFTLSVAVKVF